MAKSYTCKVCFSPFRTENKAPKYCSRACYLLDNRGENHPGYKGGTMEKTCPQCRQSFRSMRRENQRWQIYCSRACMLEAWRYKGYSADKDYGCINEAGYRLICVDSKLILEHRYVMEQAIGRPLLPTEIVHHKDHNRLHNAIENLQLLSSHAEHRQQHRTTFVSSTHKQCTICGQIKPREDFYPIRSKRRRNNDSHDARCKKCFLAYQTARRKRAREVSNNCLI